MSRTGTTMHFVEPTPLFGATRAVSHVHTRPFVSLNATAIPGEGAIRCSVQMDTCEGVSVCVRVVCVSLCVCVCLCGPMLCSKQARKPRNGRGQLHPSCRNACPSIMQSCQHRGVFPGVPAPQEGAGPAPLNSGGWGRSGAFDAV